PASPLFPYTTLFRSRPRPVRGARALVSSAAEASAGSGAIELESWRDTAEAFGRGFEDHMAVQDARAPDDNAIVAKMDFCIPGKKVIFYPGERDKSQWPYRPHEVVIRDARAIASELELERNGFVLVERKSAVRNFYDPDEVERVYIPEVVSLVKELTGADKVITFG